MVSSWKIRMIQKYKAVYTYPPPSPSCGQVGRSNIAKKTLTFWFNLGFDCWHLRCLAIAALNRGIWSAAFHGIRTSAWHPLAEFWLFKNVGIICNCNIGFAGFRILNPGKKTRPTPISRVRDLQTKSDLEWLKMTFNDIEWPKMTKIDLKWLKKQKTKNNLK